MSHKLGPTRLDDAIVVVNLVLIMVLVGSLLFFLLEACYQGQFEGRLRFILGAFVMAIVLIARIAAEQGRQYSLMFALPLGIVTGLAILRFVHFQGPLAGASMPINVGLMLLVWWAADRLTWDCTIADETREPSGEGLLMNIGLDPPPAASPPSTPDPAASSPSVAKFLRTMLARNREHKPGLWVLLFSLAALPLFGFGQVTARAHALSSRRYLFQLLLLYVASAFGLLLSTSLLGLRRYLRQRHVEMGNSMAAVWLVAGGGTLILLLAFCFCLPRRNPEYSITHFVAGDQAKYQTSRYAHGRDGRQQNEQADRVAQDVSAKDRGGTSDHRQGRSSPDDTNPQGDDQSQGQADGRPNQPPGQAESSPESSGSPPPARPPASDIPGQPRLPLLPSVGTMLADAIKGLYYVVVLLVAAYLVYRYHRYLRQALLQLRQSLRELWQKLFGGRPGERSADAPVSLASREEGGPRPFADFFDPFTNEQARRWPLDELVVYSFQALEAWGREHGCPRGRQQTPTEFARQVAHAREPLSREAKNLAHLYSLVAYARGRLPAESSRCVEQFWAALRPGVERPIEE